MIYTEEEKIKKGNEIKEQVNKIWFRCFDHRNYSELEMEGYQKQVKNLWGQCLGHYYKWFSHDSCGGGDCHCIYCGAESERTRIF